MNWYTKLQSNKLDLEDELEALLQEIRGEYPGIQLEAWITHGYSIEIANIKVPPGQRNQGIGTSVINRIQNFAKEKNLPITVRPSPEKGKKEALERFYKNLDFKHNRGRNMDYELSSPLAPTMYWKLNIKNKRSMNFLNQNKIRFTKTSSIDIGSSGYGALSNFAAYPFIIDGIQCGGMEGFLQSLKFSDPDKQARVCGLYGVKAKYKGKKSKWYQDQNLHWMGQTFSRHSTEYQELLDRAFNSLFEQSQEFRDALASTGNEELTHTIGKPDPNMTVLTENEFISRLYRLRRKLESAHDLSRGSTSRDLLPKVEPNKESINELV